MHIHSRCIGSQDNLVDSAAWVEVKSGDISSVTGGIGHQEAHEPGAIAGIAVGVVTLVISSVVLGLYFWRRRKQQRLQHTDAVELEGSSRGLKHFMGGKWRAEQDGTSQPVEAGSTSVNIIPGPPVELDSTPTERIR